MKTYNLALFLVAGITVASTIFAVKQGILPDTKLLLRKGEVASASDFKFPDSLKIWKSSKTEVSKELLSQPVELDSKAFAFADLAKPIYYEPKSLTFSGSTLVVEKVGLTPDETLETPKSWFTTGWYIESSKAGENGNTIIDGHYDTNTGTPGAFWALKNLKVNDTVILRDSMDKDFTYKVRSVFYVDIQDPDRTLIFEETNKPELTLITCGGVWNTAKHTYDKRLVVKADLVSSNAR